MNQLTGDHYKAGFHKKPLFIVWLPVINLAVLIAAAKWSKYSFYIHALLTLGVIGLTLASTVHILVADWIHPDQERLIQKIHNIAGLVVTIWIVFQIFTGLFARYAQFSKNMSPRFNIWMRKFHHISSYIVILTAKFDYLNIKIMKDRYDQFFLYLSIQLVCLIIYLWFKLSFWTLSEDIIQGQLVHQPTQITSNKIIQFSIWIIQKLKNIKQQLFQKSFPLPQLKKGYKIIKSQKQIQINNYILFIDYVYNIDSLKYYHPGGRKIIELVNKRQVDRFLYGFFIPEMISDVIIHQHSKESLRLCGEPVAKIQRLLPIKGLKDYNKVKVAKIFRISQKSAKHLVYLNPLMRQQLQYEGYKEQSQFGQYFSLTTTNSNGRKRVTRLYSCIWSLRLKNSYLMKKLLPEGNQKRHQQIQATSFCNQDLEERLISSEQNQAQTIDYKSIPLLMKKYKQGKFTSRFLSKKFNGEIILSKPLGAGLKYHQLNDNGKVIIMTGGTGIIPFIDLIDILFKRVKLLQNDPICKALCKTKQTILNKDLIKNRQFHFYCAGQQIQDFLPMTLHQLNYLSNQMPQQFKVTMRIRDSKDSVNYKFESFKFDQRLFSQHLQQIARQNVCKMYFCGPHKMNQDVSRFLRQNKVQSDLYEFV